MASRRAEIFQVTRHGSKGLSGSGHVSWESIVVWSFRFVVVVVVVVVVGMRVPTGGDDGCDDGSDL